MRSAFAKSLGLLVLFAWLAACEPPAPPALHAYKELATGDDTRLVVLLHGYGANEHDLVSFARDVGLQGPLVSYRGPLTVGTGYAWFPIDFNAAAEARYDGAAADAVLPRVATNIRRAQLQQTANEIVVIGFSQGAMLTAMLAAEYPRTVTRAVVLSGGLPRPLRPVPGDVDVFVAHGDADKVVPVARGRALKTALEEAGRHVTYQEFGGLGHGISPGVRDAVKAWLAKP